MARQIVISSIVATVIVSIVLLATRQEPAAAVAVASSDDAAALKELRDELRSLREDLDELRALRQAAPTLPSAAAPPAAEVAPYDEEPAEPRREAQTASNEDTQAGYRAELAQTEKRFTMLGGLVQAQSRNASWASARQAEITGLTTRHEYFKNTKFDTVDCRSSLCRVVASFPTEQDQDVFGETFHGFVPSFPNASLRAIPGSNPPRTEVFLSIDGPLPR